MSSSSSSIIRLIILLSFDLSLILYLFALKRDRGEKRKREKKPFRIHLSAKNFETSPYLKLLIKITLLIIISFLNFHEFLARNKQHLFIENNIVTGQLYTCSTIYRSYIVARDPSRNEIPLDPTAHPREIIIAGQVTLGPSNPVIFLTKNRRPFLDGASPRSDISNKRARPSCIYILPRDETRDQSASCREIGEREREHRNKSRRMDTRERNNPIRRACGSRSRVRKRSRIEEERVAGASVSRPALGRDP